MSARCLPERPRFRSRAEKVAFHALASKLRDVDVLLANVRFTGLDGDWEVDLVIGMPDAGFAAIEVKGGNVWRADGTWWQQTPQGRRAIDLEDQATSGKYLLRRYLERNPHWSHGKPRMIHMVILPDTTLGPEDPSPGLPRQWIIDKDQLPAAMQVMAPAAQAKLISETAERRNELKRQISELTEERTAYLHKKVDEAGGAKDSLDDKIYRAVREQAGRLGMSYEADAPAY